MNETVLPAQILVWLALIEIVGVTVGFTVMVMLFEVTVAGEAQAAVLVISTVTISLLEIVDVVYVDVVTPTDVPFFFHT